MCRSLLISQKPGIFAKSTKVILGKIYMFNDIEWLAYAFVKLPIKQPALP